MPGTLYHLDECPHCEKVRLALDIEKIAWTSRRIERDDRSEVERVSGQDGVPVWVDGDTVLSDSEAILDLLAGREGSRLIPDGRRAQSFARVLIDRADTSVGPLCSRIRRERGDDDRALLPEDLTLLRRRLDQEMEVLDGSLEGRRFLFGEHPTVADVVHHAYLNRLEAAGKLTIPESLARVREWYGRILSAAGR